jgi:hypothetical protein
MAISLIGSVLGPVAELPAGSSATQSSGRGYGVAIGDEFFHLAVGDESPYQRATAQFKKDQLDAASTPGDQSLTGWWTRGQLSFHKGMGVNYYEVVDGETVLNRYTDALGVNPFDLGRVTLNHAFAADTTLTTVQFSDASDAVQAYYDNGTVAARTTPGVAFTTVTATASGCAVSPGAVYAIYQTDKIRRAPTTALGSPVTIYTHSTVITGVWYAKDRLILVDDTDTWYQLAPNPAVPPVAIAAGDKAFTASDSPDNWVLCSTPGPILVANGTRVYAITPDGTSGAIPTLSAPIQVAELPVGEKVTAMTAYLGFVVLATTMGFRVAALSASGDLTYGPLAPGIGSLTYGATGLAKTGTSVYGVVIGNSEGDGLWQVDLSQQIGTGLEFAWTRSADHGIANTATAFGCHYWRGSLYSWGGTTLKKESTSLETSGTLTTGYHRFATLEPKRFESVKVRASGTGGTITVSRVDQNGSVSSLHTLDVSADHEAEIGLGLSTPMEAVGLRFTLTRSATDVTLGPTLLGYQLRALPEPQRQRLLRIPLLIKDVERRQPTRADGHAGGAWERLRALEEMESAGTSVIYQDFRTGETANVYIESVEFTNKTPPSAGSSGFGGTCFLTIRKLN